MAGFPIQILPSVVVWVSDITNTSLFCIMYLPVLKLWACYFTKKEFIYI
jgi:hypothetical protein